MSQKPEPSENGCAGDLATAELNLAKRQCMKILVVTRAFPVENTIGSHSYLLALVAYLKKSGFRVRLLVLDPSPGGNVPVFVIPASARRLFPVLARDNIQISHLLLRFKSFADCLVSPVWAAYYAVAEALQNLLCRPFHGAMIRMHHILRQFATVKNNTVQPWDALTTSDEVDFCRNAFLADKPDVVIANYAFLGHVFSAIPPETPALRVILTHDVRHERVRDFEKKRIPILGESELDLQKEKRLLAGAQLLLAIQEEDAASLKDMMPQCEVLTVPMPAVLKSTLANQVSGRCLFVGSLANHNVYGLNWLLENVWPLVLRSVPYATLHVCGTVCHTITKEAQNVSFLGRVDDLITEYGAAQVCLVPLIVGSGLKIKLVEALSYGRVCVSTPIGVQGIRDIQDKAVVVADSAQSFAMAVQRILTDTDKRRSMEEQARSFVSARLSPETVYQPLVDRICRHMSETVGLEVA
ncbi:MAG: glycosyltransferase [Thermodesulfobacteriota bacterium]|nr:glycosyltransferase [Thermodesulfobacteriota bacterium]